MDEPLFKWTSKIDQFHLSYFFVLPAEPDSHCLGCSSVLRDTSWFMQTMRCLPLLLPKPGVSKIDINKAFTASHCPIKVKIQSTVAKTAATASPALIPLALATGLQLLPRLLVPLRAGCSSCFLVMSKPVWN